MKSWKDGTTCSMTNTEDDDESSLGSGGRRNVPAGRGEAMLAPGKYNGQSFQQELESLQ